MIPEKSIMVAGLKNKRKGRSKKDLQIGRGGCGTGENSSNTGSQM